MKMIKIIIVVALLSTIAFAQSGKVTQGKISYEGRDYKTVKIGKQVWMAENLNYKPKKSKGMNICAGCEDFGRLYSWNSAMDIEPEAKEKYDMESRAEGRPISKNHQGICPIGWHIPTVNDMRELLAFINVKGMQEAGEWQDSFLKYIQRDVNEFIFPRDGGRSRSASQTMNYNGVTLCEPNFWERNGNGEDVCKNSYGLSIRSSGTGEFRELDKCIPGQMLTDFDSGKRVCCSEGCAGDHFAMWLADENTACQDKVKKGRHSCEYKPEAAIFVFNQYAGLFFQEIHWKYKNSYASVRCLKD